MCIYLQLLSYATHQPPSYAALIKSAFRCTHRCNALEHRSHYPAYIVAIISDINTFTLTFMSITTHYICNSAPTSCRAAKLPSCRVADWLPFSQRMWNRNFNSTTCDMAYKCAAAARRDGFVIKLAILCICMYAYVCSCVTGSDFINVVKLLISLHSAVTTITIAMLTVAITNWRAQASSEWTSKHLAASDEPNALFNVEP